MDVAKRAATLKRTRLLKSTIQEMGERWSELGPVLYIRVQRYDHKPMGWEDLWERFSDAYPGRWAVQVFPPAEALVNEANIYHLFVLAEGASPLGMTINRGS